MSDMLRTCVCMHFVMIMYVEGTDNVHVGGKQEFPKLMKYYYNSLVIILSAILLMRCRNIQVVDVGSDKNCYSLQIL